MDATTIEDEIYQFNDFYLKDAMDLIEKHFDFIENNELRVPKANYIFLKDYLYDTIRGFELLDFRFETKTILKLKYDIRILESLYDDILLYDIENIFEYNFMKHSPLILMILEKIDTLKNMKKISPDDFELKVRISLDLKKLKKIYYSYFEKIFQKELKYLQKDILKIINSKLFYIDELIWLESKKSKILKKHFENIDISYNANSKNHLSYIITKERTHTSRYKYLQLCLRVYK